MTVTYKFTSGGVEQSAEFESILEALERVQVDLLEESATPMSIDDHEGNFYDALDLRRTRQHRM